jgi:hypothetical protein
MLHSLEEQLYELQEITEHHHSDINEINKMQNVQDLLIQQILQNQETMRTNGNK